MELAFNQKSSSVRCDGAEHFINLSYCLGLSYQTTYTSACNVLGLACQAFGWFNALDSRTKD